MKIEKVNDNQIRCTLTKEDLLSRRMDLSELAYGTEKAKSLFRDMMAQANHEFGFSAENMPLLIEAIPMSAESLVLMITKVEDPEELDTRFARFTPSVLDDFERDEDEDDDTSSESDSRNEIKDLFHQIRKQSTKLSGASQIEQKPITEEPEKLKVFCFSNLPSLISATKGVRNSDIESSLYKDTQNDQYLLFLKKAEQAPEIFTKLCNHFSEYATPLAIRQTTPAFIAEHCKCLLSVSAIQKISQL